MAGSTQRCGEHTAWREHSVVAGSTQHWWGACSSNRSTPTVMGSTPAVEGSTQLYRSTQRCPGAVSSDVWGSPSTGGKPAAVAGAPSGRHTQQQQGSTPKWWSTEVVVEHHVAGSTQWQGAPSSGREHPEVVGSTQRWRGALPEHGTQPCVRFKSRSP